MIKIKITLITSIIFTVLSGCTNFTPEKQKNSNPAIVFCNKLGGKILFSEKKSDNTMYCQTPNAKIIDAWWLYNNRFRTNPVIYTNNV